MTAAVCQVRTLNILILRAESWCRSLPLVCIGCNISRLVIIKLYVPHAPIGLDAVLAAMVINNGRSGHLHVALHLVLYCMKGAVMQLDVTKEAPVPDLPSGGLSYLDLFLGAQRQSICK